jgi:hypothetical protein
MAGEGVDESCSWRMGRGRKARSKRGGRRGRGGAHRGGGAMVRQHEDGAVVAVWSAGVDTRLRKERRGRRIARARAREGGREGKEKGDTATTGHPL